MRRIAIAAVLLGICCSSPEAPVQPPVRPVRPPRPFVRAWSASILTTGGYSGGGKGVFFIDSQSAKKLPLPAQSEIEAAVRDAGPEKWNTSYRPAEERMTDQFYYSFAFKIERSDSSGGAYSVAWQDESFEMLPRDLRRLYDALWAAHKDRR